MSRFLPYLAAATLCLTISVHADPAAASPTPAGPKLSPAAKSAADAGIEAMSKDKFTEAETDFLKLLKLSPNNLSALVNLGLIEYRLGRAEEAQDYLQRAIHIEPRAALAWMTLGVIYNSQEDLPGATAALAQAVYLNPKSPQAHNYFAVTLSKRGWYSAAEDELLKAIELSPGFAEAHFNLALTYLQQNPPSIELARRHYQKALDLGSPPDSEVAAKLSSAPVQSTVP